MAEDLEQRDMQGEPHQGAGAERQAGAAEPPAPGESRPGKKSRLKALLRSRKVQVTLALVVVVVALLLWWYFSLWESTDDAQIDGHINPISARVSGHVIRVNFEDNQLARAGTVLAEIDSTDYRVAVERARAELAEAQAAAGGARAGIPITAVGSSSQIATARARVDNARAGVAAARKELQGAEARLAESRAYSTKAQSDLRRYTPLVSRDIISKQQYDQVTATAKAAAAGVDAAAAGVRVARQQVTQARDQLAQMEAELVSTSTAPQQVGVARSRSASADAALKRAAAALHQAELNLSYTSVVAPVDGITGRKGVEVGQNVQPGQVLLYLVPVEDIWVTANFKENQLKKIRPGQKVTVAVDAYGRDYDGYVESIGAASGSRFSLFPPENATGNYIKVVQRIPVRIRFSRGQDPRHLLRPGMSVVPKVRVG
jgi:membrane fusion protein, multidrug efflux system